MNTEHNAVQLDKIREIIRIAEMVNDIYFSAQRQLEIELISSDERHRTQTQLQQELVKVAGRIDLVGLG